MNDFNHLFSSFQIKRMTLKNRIVMCPMGTNFADEDGMPLESMAAYYGERAKGGTGLIIVEQSVVQPVGRWSKRAAGLWDDKFIPGWKRVVDAVHAHGGKIAVQIGHLGRSTSQDITGGLQPVAPSPVPCHLTQEIPHEMTRQEVYQFIEDYILAVKRAVKAGFDAIEIHGTHGYLIASFMSGKTNKRTDEFGGSLRGRLRLPIEIIHRVRQEVGEDYPILMRIGSIEPKGGRSLEETKVVAGILAQQGIDVLDLSAGSFSEAEWEIPPYYFAPGFNMANIEAIKRSVDIPVICSGLIHEPDMAEQLLKEGRSDMVGIGRALIADPYWPEKARAGLFEEISHCIACTGCIDVLFNGGALRCTVNPFAGREADGHLAPASRKKKIVVVGGGPAGLKAASIAARRGHDVVLYEKKADMGGQVRAAAIPPDKYLMASLVRTLEVEAIKNGVTFRLGEEATAEKIQALNPDAVIMATGAVPFVPAFARESKGRILKAEDVLLGKMQTGKNVLIIGGGEIGCETAHFLAEYGKKISIVEMEPNVGANFGFIPGPLLLQKLSQWGVELLERSRVVEILENGALVQQDDRTVELTGFDSIILALGYQASNEGYERIKEMFPEVYLIGDARKPASVMNALSEAVDVGMRL